MTVSLNPNQLLIWFRITHAASEGPCVAALCAVMALHQEQCTRWYRRSGVHPPSAYQSPKYTSNHFRIHVLCLLIIWFQCFQALQQKEF